jgi:hypothetical protein
MDESQIEARVSKLEKTLSRFSVDLRLALQYIRSDAASSVTKSRLIMEKLLERVYLDEMGREPRKAMLGDMLADNQFTRRIERRIIARMNAIRDMGNLGPHGEKVHPGDAARVLDDLCEVLDWYISRNADGNLLAAAPSHMSEETRSEPTEDAALRQLQRELLLGESYWELKTLLYKVIGYLAEHPQSVAGQLLRDQVTVALGTVRPPPVLSPPGADYPTKDHLVLHRRSAAGCVLSLLGVALLALLYWLLRR